MFYYMSIFFGHKLRFNTQAGALILLPSAEEQHEVQDGLAATVHGSKCADDETEITN